MNLTIEYFLHFLPVVIAIENDESEDIKRPKLSEVIVYDPDDQKIFFKKLRS